MGDERIEVGGGGAMKDRGGWVYEVSARVTWPLLLLRDQMLV